MKHIEASNYSADGKLFLHAGLWLAQLLLAGVYLAGGIAVISLPAPELAAILPWTGHMSGMLLKFIGGVDLAAGLGVLLPSVTRIAPVLTAVTALCFAALQALVILSHALIGALPAPLLINVAVLALSLFIAWGRSDAARISPRQYRRMPDIDAFVRVQTDEREGSVKTLRRAITRGRENASNRIFPARWGMRGALSTARKQARLNYQPCRHP